MKLSRTAAALVGVFALVAVACGDDDDDDDRGTGRAEAPAETSAPAGTEAPATSGGTAPAGGGDFSSILLPKCTGNAVFDQANEGAREAAAELGVAEPEFVGPAACTDTTGQIEFVTNAVTQGVDAIMVSNNAGDQLDPGDPGGRRRRHHRRGVGLTDPVSGRARACSSPRSTSTRPAR